MGRRWDELVCAYGVDGDLQTRMGSEGRWKLFWKVSNWEPPVPFTTIMKWFCRVMFSLYITTGMWTGVGIITCYWMPLYDRQELLGMYVIGLVGRMLIGMVS